MDMNTKDSIRTQFCKVRKKSTETVVGTVQAECLFPPALTTRRADVARQLKQTCLGAKTTYVDKPT